MSKNTSSHLKDLQRLLDAYERYNRNYDYDWRNQEPALNNSGNTDANIVDTGAIGNQSGVKFSFINFFLLLILASVTTFFWITAYDFLLVSSFATSLVKAGVLLLIPIQCLWLILAFHNWWFKAFGIITTFILALFLYVGSFINILDSLSAKKSLNLLEYEIDTSKFKIAEQEYQGKNFVLYKTKCNTEYYFCSQLHLEKKILNNPKLIISKTLWQNELTWVKFIFNKPNLIIKHKDSILLELNLNEVRLY